MNAFAIALDVVCEAIASRRVAQARGPANPEAQRPDGVEEQVCKALLSLRTVEQLQQAYNPVALRKLAENLKASFGAKLEAIIDGQRAADRRRQDMQTYHRMRRTYTEAACQPCEPEELEQKLEAKSRELGREAIPSDLGPVKHPFKQGKKLRKQLAQEMGIDESTIRRWEADETAAPDISGIYKSPAEYRAALADARKPSK